MSSQAQTIRAHFVSMLEPIFQSVDRQSKLLFDIVDAKTTSEKIKSYNEWAQANNDLLELIVQLEQLPLFSNEEGPDSANFLNHMHRHLVTVLSTWVQAYTTAATVVSPKLIGFEQLIGIARQAP